MRSRVPGRRHWRATEDLLKGVPVFLDPGNRGHGSVHAMLTHFDWIDDR